MPVVFYLEMYLMLLMLIRYLWQYKQHSIPPACEAQFQQEHFPPPLPWPSVADDVTWSLEN